AARVVFDLPWNIFTSATKVINDLEIDTLAVEISSPAPVPEPSGEPTPLPKIRLDRLVVRGGSLHYANASTNLRIPSYFIDVTSGHGFVRLDAPVTVDPDVSLEIPEIPVSLSDHGVGFTSASWKIKYGEYTGSGLALGQIN